MKDFIPYLGIVAAIIGGSVALYIRHKNRTQAAKDTFGVFIREQLAALPDRGMLAFYNQTKPAIRTAKERIYHFLPTEQRIRLNHLWHEYDQIPAQEIDGTQEGAMGESSRALDTLAGLPTTKTPQEIIRYYLDEFYKFSA